ncbi:DUF3263 domain-containing protein [Williamsia sp.]|uniref:DUF3263 domain-containing protein n=1 Tax=Williamsia sp. TaxID=1872085 RepID=UPI002F959247
MGEDNAIDQEMLEFEERWFRFGGGPSDEIFTRFGMTDRTFFGAMETLMGREYALDQVAPGDVEVMRAVIRRRLWLAS